MSSTDNWWNRGKNMRVPNEDNASWSKLIKDDMSQLTHTDRAYESKKTSILSWRPFKAFSARMLETGPSPLVRQLVKRIL